SGDTVFIKRKKARAYAYGALDHRDQEEEALRHLSRTFERGRASAARGRSGRGRRVVVRTQSGGTAVRSSGLSQTVGGGKNIRERPSAPGNSGASSSPQG